MSANDSARGPATLYSKSRPYSRHPARCSEKKMKSQINFLHRGWWRVFREQWMACFIPCELWNQPSSIPRETSDHRREPWFLFNSPWTLIFFHVIVNSLGNLNFNCSIEQLGTYCVTETSFSTQALRHVAATTLGTCLGQPTWRKQDRKLRSRDSTEYNCFDDCAFQSFFYSRR